MNTVSSYFSKFFPMTEEQKQYLENMVTTKTVEAGTYIVDQGQICRKMVYLQEGTTAMIYERDNKVYIKDFIFEDSIATVYESYLTQQPARYALKALTPCMYQSLSKHEIQRVTEMVPQLRNVARILTENVYLNISQRFESLITLSAEERYIQLLERRPRLLSDVPLYLVASYLGITDVALSRIRNRVAQKNK